MAHDSNDLGRSFKQLRRLKRRGDEEALIAELRSPLEKGTIAVRARAARYLGDVGGGRAVEPVLRLLKDENPNVRASAALALGHIGHSAATAPLIDVLDDPDRITRARVIGSLGEIGDPTAVPHLIALVDDRDWYFVRGQALYALGLIDDPEAHDVFTREIRRVRWTRRRTVLKAIRKHRARRRAAGSK